MPKPAKARRWRPPPALGQLAQRATMEVDDSGVEKAAFTRSRYRVRAIGGCRRPHRS